LDDLDFACRATLNVARLVPVGSCATVLPAGTEDEAMNTFSINPNVAIALNIAYGILAGLSIPTLNALGFTTDASAILAWAGMVSLVLNGILHGYSSSVPGPLAPPDSPAVIRAMALPPSQSK
jgi:hypothetical protein